MNPKGSQFQVLHKGEHVAHADSDEDAKWAIEADVRKSMRSGDRRRTFDYTVDKAPD